MKERERRGGGEEEEDVEDKEGREKENTREER